MARPFRCQGALDVPENRMLAFKAFDALQLGHLAEFRSDLVPSQIESASL
jgi:hypothetical protein